MTVTEIAAAGAPAAADGDGEARDTRRADDGAAAGDGDGLLAMIAAAGEVTGLDIDRDIIPVIRDGWFRGLRPVRALLEAGVLNAATIEEMTARKMGVISIDPSSITAEASVMLPMWFCEQHNIVPVSIDGEGVLVVASSQPLRSLAKVELEEIVGCRVEYRLAAPEAVAACVASVNTRLGDPDGGGDIGGSSEALNRSMANWRALAESDSSETDITRHVVALMTQAVAVDASDIHVQTELTETGAQIVTARLRRLGDLVSHGVYTPEHGTRIINRLKVAGGFDVDPTKPCDGRYDITIPGSGRYDLRLAGMPLSQGQMLVVRLLPHQRKGKSTLKDLFPPKYSDLAERMGRLASQPEGMILVVGSTGTGKSTTLAAMIRPLAENPALKVVTVEDPVENMIRGAQQVEVTQRLGFSDALRGFLRSDPDVILIGEIRDEDTAGMAIRAAQTGHAVISTMHASAVELTPGRLAEMGVPRAGLADVLLGVASQRLVKTLCEHCSSARPGRTPAPRGCEACARTGWGGRAAIAELMEVDETTSDLIADNAPIREIRRSASVVSYSEFAAKLIDAGVTTRDAVVAKLGSAYDPSFETGTAAEDEAAEAVHAGGAAAAKAA